MNIKNAPNINYLWASLMIEELIRNGANYFCICPGSRSSALAIAAADNDKARTHIHFDERANAFHALGYSAATKRPAVIITTSGTAVANLLPAVIETSKKKLPLIILSADRPPELRFTGANQTIDQVKMFGDYARWFVDMPCPTEEIAPEFVLTTIDQAVFKSRTANPAGPVHINCMFREPLTPAKVKLSKPAYTSKLSEWSKSDKPFTQYHKAEVKCAPEAIQEAFSRIKPIKNGVIVVGKLATEEDQKAVLKLSEKLSWPVFADITSGLRLGNEHKNIIHYFDQILQTQKLKHHACEGVIHIGGRITSKNWYTYVEKSKPREYIMVLNHPLRNDPMHNVTMRVQSKYEDFCTQLSKLITQRRSTQMFISFRKANSYMQENITNTIAEETGLTEKFIARAVSIAAPAEHTFFLSNSSPVRDMDAFADHSSNALTVAANRGASGIDGIIASAIGYTRGSNAPATLIIGDLAFLYDLNSLSMLKEADIPLIIVVLNNNGGGIFKRLPIAKNNPHFSEVFETPHDLSFHGAAELFGINYALAETKEDFSAMYANALEQNTSIIIEATIKE